jgi:Sap, sulfolipid-1-addressing protein
VSANTVLFALLLAVMPLPVLASVLCLTTENGRAKAAALAAGWIAALAVIGIATVVLAGQVDTSSGSTASTASAWLDVLLGVAAVVYGMYVRRQAASGTAAEPSWMGRLDAMSPWVAFGLGAFIPPYVIVIAGANSILRSQGSSSSNVVAVLIFTVVGSLGVIIPLLVATLSKDPDALLADWRTKLLANWHQVVFWLLLLVGIYLVIKGIYELTS